MTLIVPENPVDGQTLNAGNKTYTYNASEGAWDVSGQGLPGQDGDRGWSPQYRVVEDGERRVLELYDYINGEGVKPTATGFVGATGLVADAAMAVDIRGQMGMDGPPGADSTVPGPEGPPGPEAPSGNPRYVKVTDFDESDRVSPDSNRRIQFGSADFRNAFRDEWNDGVRSFCITFSQYAPVIHQLTIKTEFVHISDYPEDFLTESTFADNRFTEGQKVIGGNFSLTPRSVSAEDDNTMATLDINFDDWSFMRIDFPNSVAELATGTSWTYRLEKVQGARGPAGEQGEDGMQGDDGPRGYRGYTPEFNIIRNGERRIVEVSGWESDNNDPADQPHIGFITGTGELTSDATQAVDIRGERGPAGQDGPPINVEDVTLYLGRGDLTPASGTTLTSANTGLAGFVADDGFTASPLTWTNTNTKSNNQDLTIVFDTAVSNGPLVPTNGTYRGASHSNVRERGEIVLPEGVWLVCASLNLRTTRSSGSFASSNRQQAVLVIQHGDLERHGQSVYLKNNNFSSSVYDDSAGMVSVTGVVVSDGTTPTKIVLRVATQSSSTGGNLGFEIRGAHVHGAQQAIARQGERGPAGRDGQDATGGASVSENLQYIDNHVLADGTETTEWTDANPRPVRQSLSRVAAWAFRQRPTINEFPETATITTPAPEFYYPDGDSHIWSGYRSWLAGQTINPPMRFTDNTFPMIMFHYKLQNLVFPDNTNFTMLNVRNSSGDKEPLMRFNTSEGLHLRIGNGGSTSYTRTDTIPLDVRNGIWHGEIGNPSNTESVVRIPALTEPLDVDVHIELFVEGNSIGTRTFTITLSNTVTNDITYPYQTIQIGTNSNTYLRVQPVWRLNTVTNMRELLLRPVNTANTDPYTFPNAGASYVITASHDSDVTWSIPTSYADFPINTGNDVHNYDTINPDRTNKVLMMFAPLVEGDKSSIRETGVYVVVNGIIQRSNGNALIPLRNGTNYFADAINVALGNSSTFTAHNQIMRWSGSYPNDEELLALYNHGADIDNGPGFGVTLPPGIEVDNLNVDANVNLTAGHTFMIGGKALEGAGSGLPAHPNPPEWKEYFPGYIPNAHTNVPYGGHQPIIMQDTNRANNQTNINAFAFGNSIMSMLEANKNATSFRITMNYEGDIFTGFDNTSSDYVSDTLSLTFDLPHDQYTSSSGGGVYDKIFSSSVGGYFHGSVDRGPDHIDNILPVSAAFTPVLSSVGSVFEFYLRAAWRDPSNVDVISLRNIRFTNIHVFWK